MGFPLASRSLCRRNLGHTCLSQGLVARQPCSWTFRAVQAKERSSVGATTHALTGAVRVRRGCETATDSRWAISARWRSRGRSLSAVGLLDVDAPGGHRLACSRSTCSPRGALPVLARRLAVEGVAARSSGSDATRPSDRACRGSAQATWALLVGGAVGGDDHGSNRLREWRSRSLQAQCQPPQTARPNHKEIRASAQGQVTLQGSASWSP